MNTILKDAHASPVVSDSTFNRTRSGTLSVRRSLVSTLTAALFSGLLVSGAADARVRGMNFGMDQVAFESVNASAHGHGCSNGMHELSHTHSGNMVYQRTVDQAMIDQMNAVMSVGGSTKIIFTLRTGLSTLGNGYARVEGMVTVSAGGSTIASFSEVGESPPGGTTSNNYTVTIDPSVIAGMSAGGTITVTATGTGQAHSNGCSSSDQAIASWYFTSMGKPFIGTTPH